MHVLHNDVLVIIISFVDLEDVAALRYVFRDMKWNVRHVIKYSKKRGIEREFTERNTKYRYDRQKCFRPRCRARCVSIVTWFSGPKRVHVVPWVPYCSKHASDILASCDIYCLGSNA